MSQIRLASTMKVSVIACLALMCAHPNDYGITARKPKMTPAEEILIQEGDELRILCQGEGRLHFSTEKYRFGYGYILDRSKFTIEFDETSGTYTFIRLKAIRQDTGWYACAKENIVIYNYDGVIDTREKYISWIYVYVNSSVPFIVMGNQFQRQKAVVGASAIIPCRPTSPNLSVILVINFDDTLLPGEASYDPKIGFTIRHVGKYHSGNEYTCKLNATDGKYPTDWPKYELVIVDAEPLRLPEINQDTLNHVVWGMNITLVCTIRLPRGIQAFLNWTVPKSVPQERLRFPEYLVHSVLEVEHSSYSEIWEAELILENVKKTDAGEYTCVARDENGHTTQASKEIQMWDPNYIYFNVSMVGERYISVLPNGFVEWKIMIDTYPDKANWSWYNQHGIEISDFRSGDESKYSHERRGIYHSYRIEKVNYDDIGFYTINVTTPHNETSIILRLTVSDGYTVSIRDTKSYYAPGETAILSCDVEYVLNFTAGSTQWSYIEYPDYPSKKNAVYRSLKNTSYNWFANSDRSHLNLRINMTDVDGYFGIKAPDSVTEGDNITVTCGVSVYSFTNVITWTKPRSIQKNEAKRIKITRHGTKFMWQSKLEMHNVTKLHSGSYFCKALNEMRSIESKEYRLSVEDARKPRFTNNETNESKIFIDLKKDKNITVTLECLADGRPTPEVTWFKNDEPLVAGKRYTFLHNNSKLEMKDFSKAADGGRYSCYATNRVGEVQRHTYIDIEEKEPLTAIYWAGLIIAFLSILSVVMVIWIVIRIRRERESRKRFMEATLERFSAGALNDLNPELNMAHQAELLPYHEKWEFPRELLKLDKVLGSGAFGIVKKAEAKSIFRSEAVTTVAVKLVQMNHKLHCMTALIRELKILAHLGKHLNVVNLLGACTKDISYGQLLVIVEFYRFGNLHDYLLRRRADFLNKAGTTATGNIHTGSSSITGGVDADIDSGVDATSCRSTDSTDTRVEVEDCVPDADSVEPTQHCRYRGDYTDENLEPIGTGDLLCWAWQVSRGMKYLGSRRILHGDLAARNILLADNNVVKICDFGLAKALYKEDNYTKKGHDPLPFKWMAIESLRDRVFSIRSDIWSYGVVLWEFFSLAESPYPGMHPENLYRRLADGFRMAKPKYATDGVYDTMLRCWNAEPSERPSFGKLESIIADLMDKSIKTHYLSLSEPYMQMNAEAMANGERDYLTMILPEDACITSGPTLDSN